MTCKLKLYVYAECGLYVSSFKRLSVLTRNKTCKFEHMNLCNVRQGLLKLPTDCYPKHASTKLFKNKP